MAAVPIKMGNLAIDSWTRKMTTLNMKAAIYKLKRVTWDRISSTDLSRKPADT